MKYIVDRRCWSRGAGYNDENLLLNTDGTLCCIGFVGQQCKVADKDLIHKAFISELDIEEQAKYPSWMTVEGGDIQDAYEINDEAEITDEEREEKLKALFIKNGDEIEFIN